MLHEARQAYHEGRTFEADALCRHFLRRYPASGEALYLIGQLYATRGDYVEAIRVFEQALAYGLEEAQAWSDLASACLRSGQVEATIRHLQHVITLQPDFFQAYAQLANLYHEIGRISEAAALYGAWASRDPANSEVVHMAAATSGEGVPERCSNDYVRTHFDKLASSFDKRLVSDLAYTGHQQVAKALSRYAAAAPWGSVLDAGCGTGLCGPLLRPHCHRLVGIDLSEQMIMQARDRTSYDELVVEEIGAFMRARPLAFDAIVSSDVFIYLGKLDEPVRAAHRALKPGGLLVVTFESLTGSDQESYQLQSNGRYAHRDVYIQSTLAEAAFDLLELADEPIRREFGRDVTGLLVVARK